jgi:hypothetical protein
MLETLQRTATVTATPLSNEDIETPEPPETEPPRIGVFSNLVFGGRMLYPGTTPNMFFMLSVTADQR